MLAKGQVVRLVVYWLPLCVLAACRSAEQPTPRRDAPAREELFTTTVVTPNVLRGLPTGPVGHDGKLAVTPCATCHGARDTSGLPGPGVAVAGPHSGLRHKHGELACAACHAAEQRDRLHLADGRSIPLLDAMLLCGQCHGPQKRDYDHGAHGGMRGHWDLASGPRKRNHCVACHDPHAPAFGHFQPVLRPRDRFLPGETPAHD